MLFFTDTKELTKRFIKNKWNPDDFLFAIISTTVTTDNTYRCKQLSELAPDPGSIQQAMDGNEVASNESYLQKLMYVPYVDTSIGVLVKTAATKNTPIVFVCGPMEEDSVGYFKTLREYINTVYGVDTYTLKDLQKKGMETLRIPYVDSINERVMKRIEKHISKDPNLPKIVDQILNKDKIEAELEAKRKKRKKKKKKKKKMSEENPFI